MTVVNRRLYEYIQGYVEWPRIRVTNCDLDRIMLSDVRFVTMLDRKLDFMRRRNKTRRAVNKLLGSDWVTLLDCR